MVRLTNPNGNIKTCPTGFSWTALFFGPFVPLFRGWFAMVPIYLGGSFLTFGIFGIVMPFQLNRYWLSYLLDVGFEPTTAADARMIAELGLPDPKLPHWATSALKTYRAGDSVPYGLYVALNCFDYRFIGEEDSPLDGLRGTEYMRLLLVLTLALVPFLALFFYFAFPVIIVGSVAFTMFKLVLKPLATLMTRKPHLAQLHWDPVMAHMKRPEKEEKRAKDCHENGKATDSTERKE